jgi:hypothetical protein
MPLRNRVTPWGEIVATEARGLVMGNRGVLINARGETTERRWTTHAWIACRMDFQGRARPVAPPGRWTALFFSDDAAALAAGHRPCGYCRRDDYLRFKAVWAKVHGDASAPEMDARIHPDRLAARPVADPRTLPDGTFVGDARACFRVEGGLGLPWSWTGYGAPTALPRALPLVTAPVLVAVLAAGYVPAPRDARL